MGEYLDFNAISLIPFKTVLDFLNEPYTEVKGELKGQGFIVNIAKNIYFNPIGKDKGSVINYVSYKKDLGLRETAKLLKDTFLKEPEQPKREIPTLELHYCKKLEELGLKEDFCKEYEIGLVKTRSIMAGLIAFRVYDFQGNSLGYVGLKDEGWFFPKGFVRPVYNLHRITDFNRVILTNDIIKCCTLNQDGLQAVSLMGNSMTDDQLKSLTNFDNISLLHPQPDNLILRLSKNHFVKSLA